MRFFNTAGPCDAERHYMLPASPRLPDARLYIERGGYFTVFAPRQTGKTTALRALARELTSEGKYAALYFSCEAGEPLGEDLVEVQRVVLDAIRRNALGELPAALHPPAWPEATEGALLGGALEAWATACPRPLVLFFDEIDALRGESLRSVLRQLRAGYSNRPHRFPHGVVLCGLRDVRDYKAASGGDPERLGTSSPFNIKVASVRVPDFTAADVRALLGQHSAETGQPFEEEAIEAVYSLTHGQPWLVNALARETVRELATEGQPVTHALVDRAKENLILRRETHLDSLVAKLNEPRVKRVMVPLMDGESALPDLTFDDDASYVRDLGLIARDNPLRVANPIYREVIVRVLSGSVQAAVTASPKAFVLADGRLDFPCLLADFADFWREHGANLAGKMAWREVAAQLVFMAFLQRIVNGGGYVDREYGIGRGRIDLLVRWPWSGGLQREAVELKVWAEGRPDPLVKGLKQLDAYLAGLNLKEGTLVIFDRRPDQPEAEERTRFEAAVTASGRAVVVLRA